MTEYEERWQKLEAVIKANGEKADKAMAGELSVEEMMQLVESVGLCQVALQNLELGGVLH